ncbi:MAG: hypothetical protein P1S46_12240 [bacterium]|nr:hypothetical protein [bacterium]
MIDLKRYFGRVKDALFDRDDLAAFEAGIAYRVGPGCEDTWPSARMQVHWHPPLAVARETEPIKTVSRFRRWIESRGFRRKSA